MSKEYTPQQSGYRKVGVVRTFSTVNSGKEFYPSAVTHLHHMPVSGSLREIVTFRHEKMRGSSELENSQKDQLRFIGRIPEIALTVLDGLVSNKLPERPKELPLMINFFGIAGIGKTALLTEIQRMCEERELPYITLSQQQQTALSPEDIANAMIRQAGELLETTPTPRNAVGKARKVIDTMRSSGPVVILFDSIDTTNEELVNWMEETFSGLTRDPNLLVVLTSQEKPESMFKNMMLARSLKAEQLKPFNDSESELYLQSLAPDFPTELNSFILQWTHGYPAAMKVMVGALTENKFDITKLEGQRELIAILRQKVIGNRVLAQIGDQKQREWYQAHLSLLSIPRRFNLVTMQEILEQFGTPPIAKMSSTLEYFGLPRRLNKNTDVLPWDVQKAGFTINELVRSIILIHQQLHQPERLIEVNTYLAKKNMEFAGKATGSDRVRYLLESLYHSTQYGDEKIVEENLETILKKIKDTGPNSDTLTQFFKEFGADKELQSLLTDKQREKVDAFIRSY